MTHLIGRPTFTFHSRPPLFPLAAAICKRREGRLGKSFVCRQGIEFGANSEPRSALLLLTAAFEEHLTSPTEWGGCVGIDVLVVGAGRCKFESVPRFLGSLAYSTIGSRATRDGALPRPGAPLDAGSVEDSLTIYPVVRPPIVLFSPQCVICATISLTT